ncbi:hypothetical protein [Qipengyuania sp. NPDC077563]|uniref:pPIWI-associating nuclease domain-containing protein n=1 Tax=Qipengyuania sp. NPDC077563 TaxID=3364497 RepID=UPI0038500919
MMSEPLSSRNLVPIDDDTLLEKIWDAVSALTADDVMGGDAADALYELSSGTIFEGIEVNSEGVFRVTDTDKFEAACTVYVELNYGGSRDGVSISDSYPATVYGTISENKEVAIADILVDTSSFFEP